MLGTLARTLGAVGPNMSLHLHRLATLDCLLLPQSTMWTAFGHTPRKESSGQALSAIVRSSPTRQFVAIVTVQPQQHQPNHDRKSVVNENCVHVRLYLGGRSIIKIKHNPN